MPNWCYAEMRVKGTKENKEKLANLFLSQNEEENKNKERYFARTWLNFIQHETLEEELEQEVSTFNLEVAWSIYSCMIEEYPQKSDKCPTIFEISKELKLEIQIASEECGCCFREFYHIKNGELLTDGTEDFPEEEFDEDKLYQEYLNNCKTEPISFDEWLDTDYQYLRDEWYNDVYDKFTF